MNNFIGDVYKNIFCKAPIPHIITDDEGNILEFNQVSLSVYGYAEEEFRKLNIDKLFYKQEVIESIKIFGIIDEKFLRFNFHRRKNGTIFPVVSNCIPIDLGDGKKYRFYTIKDNSNHYETEKKILSYLENYRYIFENLNFPIFVITPQGFITLINSRIEKETGWTIEEIVGENIEKVIDKKDLDIFWENIKIIKFDNIVTDENQTLSKEFKIRIVTKNKTPNSQCVNIVATPIIINKSTEYIIITIKEIINQDNKIKIIDDTNYKILKKIPEVILLHVNGKIRFVNDTVSDVFGYEASQLIGKSIYDFIYEEDKQIVRQNYLKRLSGLTIDNYEIRFLNKEGDIRYVNINADIVDYYGEQAVVVVINDITERKMYERALEENEERYKKLVKSLPDIVFVEADGNIIYTNNIVTKITGFQIYEVLNRPLSDFLKEGEKIELKKNILKKEVYKKTSEFIEAKLLTKSGKERDVELRTTPITYNEKPANLIVLTDITERKKIETDLLKIYDKIEFRVNERTRDMLIMIKSLENEIKTRKEVEQELRNSENRLKKVLETGPFLLFAVDTNQIITLAEGNAFSKFNIITVDIVGKKIDTVFKKYYKVSESIQKALKGENVHINMPVGEYVMECWFSPILDEKNNIIGVTGVALDITERIEAEEKIVNSLKEKEILIKEIHHRVKNNLQIIYSLLNLQSNISQNPESISVINNAKNRVRSMVLIHEKLYQSENIANINFTEYITELVNNLINSYQHNDKKINVKFDIKNNVHIDIDEAIPCGLIINEIVTNSLKYAFVNRKEGTIYIKFDFKEMKSGKIKYNLIIRDNGIGLPENIDTSKSLGMQLISSLSEQLQGEYKFNNIKSGGVEFSLRF